MKTYFSLKSILNEEKENVSLSPREMLLSDIAKTQHALEIAYAGFDNATDPDLIDCYIYEVNSVLKRYRFLLNQAQRMQIFIEESKEEERKPQEAYQPVLPVSGMQQKKKAPVIPGSLFLHHN